tara:strand:+ start:320 stop:1201 length:882 start_codon:yes stop_codon:yes gene_type:complete
MTQITLLVMAAGMGSRYGGLKQLDPVGPSSETIIDYSVFDAIQAGFTNIVFVIRKDFELDFRSKVTDKYGDRINIEFAFQDLKDLPKGFSCPDDRLKPWGTGHAILSARDLIQGPFIAINGDDFYGRESFKVIADYYNTGGENFSMVAFQLNKTLSEHGGVTRGLCTLKKDLLHTVIETENIRDESSGVISDRDIYLNGTELVSMNVWGFTPILFDYLENGFSEFLEKELHNPKSEYLIPTVVNNLIQSNQESVLVLRSSAQWFGVTYKEDKPHVINKINQLTENGVYPSSLF